MEDWLHEKDLLRRIIGEVAVDVLWHPEIKEAHHTTNCHEIHARRCENSVVIEVKAISHE